MNQLIHMKPIVFSGQQVVNYLKPIWKFGLQQTSATCDLSKSTGCNLIKLKV